MLLVLAPCFTACRHTQTKHNGNSESLLSLGLPDIGSEKGLIYPLPPSDNSLEEHLVNKKLHTDVVVRVSVLTMDQQGLRVSVIARAALFLKLVPCIRQAAGDSSILTTAL